MIELDSDIKIKMAAVKRALAEDAAGKHIKRELAKELRGLMNPLVSKQRTAVLQLPSSGHGGPSMRQAIARQIKAATRWSGRNMGVQVIQRARGMPRNFNMAGRMFNRAEGWNPTSLGGETRNQQMEPAKWFDEPTAGAKPEIARGVSAALDRAAAKIGQDARR